MTTIDPNKTTDWYIFEPKFQVRVPSEALRTEEEIRRFGTNVSGNKRVDAVLSKARSTVYLNIATMAEIAAQGYSVALVNHADCKTIYDYTQNHLDAWVKVLQNTVNKPNAPFDDLQKLDQFAQSVFAHARHLYADPSNATNGFMRSIEELGLLGEFSIFQPAIQKARNAAAVAADPNAEVAKREPLSELFLKAQVR